MPSSWPYDDPRFRERTSELVNERERERSKSLLEAVEARLRQAETFAWAVPALALTAQALLLTVVFGHSTSTTGRIMASATGVVILLAALHLLGKHTFNFDMYEAVIEREREKLELPRVSKKHLLAGAESFPRDTGFWEREWLYPEPGGNRLHRTWVKSRRRLVVDLRAIRVWAGALTLLAATDLGVFAYTVFDAI
jgi:hypothetical protein